MKDNSKTKVQLIDELVEVRHRVAELERLATERQQAEAAFRESEARFRTLVEHAPEAIVVFDADTKCFVDANENAARLFGLKRQALPKVGPLETSPPYQPNGQASHEFIQEKIQQVLNGDTPIFEWVRRSATGDDILCEARMVRLPAAGRNLVRCSLIDITDRKQAEEALRESEERYRSLYNNTPVMMHSIDSEGRLVSVSDYWLETLGYERGEVLGRFNTEFLTEDSSRYVEEVCLPEFFRTGALKDEALQFVKKNGEVLDTLLSAIAERGVVGKTVRSLAVVIDVTERRRAEQALQRYTERLEVLHTIDQAILAARSLEEIAQAGLRRIRQLVPCLRSSVVLFDEKEALAIVLAVDLKGATGLGQETSMSLIDFEVIVREFKQSKTNVVEDLLTVPNPTPLEEALLQEGVRAFINVPLLVQDQLLGVLNLGASQPHAFSAEHIDIAREVADSVAIAIQQAGLYEQVRRQAEELEQRVADRSRALAALYEVVAVAGEPLDLETTLERVLERVLPALGSPSGTIHLLNEGGDTIQLAVQSGLPSDKAAQIASLPPGVCLPGWIIEHQDSLVVSDVAADPRADQIAQIGVEAHLGVPIRLKGRVMGVLSIHREKQQQLFRAEEVELLTSIADHVGVLVESAQLRHLAQQAAVMEERARLARDLHDSVSQLLYSLTLFAEVGQESYRLGELEQVNDTLTELGEVSQQALKEMRLLIYELRPSALELEGLIGALQQRLDTVEGRAGVEAHLLVENMMELPKALEEELYLLAHEALNNTLKHAKATQVTVRIGADDRFVELEISDNGLGFDPRTVNGGGLGLISMRERAERLGGTLSLQSWPEEGTTVKVRVKIQAARPQPFSMLSKP